MEQRDERLWRIAKKRAAFKKTLLIYVLVNAGLWILWAVGPNKSDYNGIPWPVWTTGGWGIGMLFQYFDAYKTNGDSQEEKEYRRLKERS
jgi:hypothetical protein